jgi:membrane fusion protein (multidrug efflux system)
LLDKGAITRSEYDRQATQCTSTLQQVSAAQARADMITKSISDGLVRAPFDGQVTEKSVAPGEWVAPGRTLFTLVDDDPLRIELSVPEIAVRAIKQGQKVAISAVAQPEKTYSATVSRIGGEIGKSRSLIVEATLDPQTELVPGMFARATIVVGQVARPVLPKDAVIKHGKQWHAFVAVKREGANDTELEDRIVQVGPAASPDQVAILQGLAPGDRVVAKPTADLSDGTKIVDTDGPKPQAAKAEPTKAEATKAPAPKAK